MMPRAEGALELAHARLSARFGALPDEALWARLGALRDHGTLLEAVRASTLSRWIHGMAAGAGVHAIEAAVREAWRGEVRQVASWMPSAWQGAVLWWSTWLDLPLLQHVARGAAVPSWLAHDPVYQDATIQSVQIRRGQGREERSHTLDEMRSVLATEADAGEAWLASWQRRCADGTAHGPADVTRLLIAGRAKTGGISSRPVLHARRRAFALLFRRTLAEPAAAFCYLAIVAIDVERLRGELVRSVLFAAARGRA